MNKLRGVTNYKKSMPAKVIKALLWCLCILIVGTAIVAWLVSGSFLSLENVSYGVVVTLLVASFVSSMIAMSGNESALLSVAIHAAGVVLMLLIGNLVLGIGGVERLVPATAVVAGGCGAALLLNLKPKTGRNYIKRKWANG